MEQFAVVLEQYQAPPLEKLAFLFQAICGLPKLDATTKAARAIGIVAERLNLEVARRLQTALGNLKFPARLVPQVLVPSTVKGRRVQLVVADADQFGVRWMLTGHPQNYLWTDVLVISAGVVVQAAKEQILKTVEITGLLAQAYGGKSTSTEIIQRDASRDVAMATITLGRAPQQLETLRLRAPELEYATMFGADRVRSSPLENFSLLLARIGSHASAARITDETIELISAANHSPRLPGSPRFESEEAFDQYQRWLVASSLHGG